MQALGGIASVRIVPASGKELIFFEGLSKKKTELKMYVKINESKH
jgi:hypothetical protein